MNDFSDLLRAEAVAVGAPPATKKALMALLGTLGAAAAGEEARVIADRLADRERLGSTGFGGGVAIPHAKLAGLAAPVGLFVRLAQPIDYQAVDELPVDLVFALLSPDAGSEHLKALARVSRRLRDRAFLGKLRGAGSREAIYALFTAGDVRHAA
jgi:PTS system nitrogen regulatory IIA component